VPAFSLANYVPSRKNMLSGSKYGLAILLLCVGDDTGPRRGPVLPFVLAIVYSGAGRLQRLVLLLAIAPFWTSYILRGLRLADTARQARDIHTPCSARVGGFQQGAAHTQAAIAHRPVSTIEAPIYHRDAYYITIAHIDRRWSSRARAWAPRAGRLSGA